VTGGVTASSTIVDAAGATGLPWPFTFAAINVQLDAALVGCNRGLLLTLLIVALLETPLTDVAVTMLDAGLAGGGAPKCDKDFDVGAC
jgi:hypothetical protein